MLIYQCDGCNSPIPSAERSPMVSAGIGNDTFQLCKKCGAPIIAILEKKQLIKPSYAKQH